MCITYSDRGTIFGQIYIHGSYVASDQQSDQQSVNELSVAALIMQKCYEQHVLIEAFASSI